MRLLIVFFLVVFQTVSAQKYFTRTGTTEFKASVEAFEPVEAINNSTSAILTSDGSIAAQLFMTAFKFKVALMQEHFNENYMDSDEHPKGVFKGKIEGLDIANLTEQELVIKGTLTIRGKEKPIETKATLSKVDGKIHLKSSFSVAPQDFDIKIPSVVRKKIAEKINIRLDYELAEKK